MVITLSSPSLPFSLNGPDVQFGKIIIGSVSLLAPFHSSIPSRKKKLRPTESDFQYEVIMDFESDTTRIRDSLLNIKETISDWNDGPLQNNDLQDTCKDIYQTCCTVMDIMDNSLSVSDSHATPNSVQIFVKFL